ncbi:MAG: alanine dehydrogenase [Dethiobacteria bacterium]
MIIGVPKEIKDHEYRIGLIPAAVKELTRRGHRVLVEKGAGEGSGFADKEFLSAGAEIAASAREVYAHANLIVKIKEPLPSELELMQENQILFTYLHLAADPLLASKLLEKKITALAYETVEGPEGGLPLLAPMSEVGGRMAVLIGAQYLQKSSGGAGILISSVPGIPKIRVSILGGGIVGTSAAKVALGLGAEVVILDISTSRLKQLDDLFGGRVQTVFANSDNIAEQATRSHLIIGAVLVPGGRTPCLIDRELVGRLQPGTVIVDVAVDQGGCVETIRPTTHSDPVYQVDGVLHYGVPNMPGAVPRTSTIALTNATLPYLYKLLEQGVTGALKTDPGFLKGLNTYRGQVTHPTVARALGRRYTPPEELF